jgi:hypothetical protein
MIYFLVETLDDNDGGSRAAELGHRVVVVSRRRHALPAPSDGRRAPRVHRLLVPDKQAPSRQGLGLAPRKWAWVLPNTCRENDAAPVLAAGRDALRSRLGLPRGALIAVSVGWIHDGKGHDTSVENMLAGSERVERRSHRDLSYAGPERRLAMH